MANIKTTPTPGAPQWRMFNRDEDRTWHRFDATYGKNFASTMVPHEEAQMAGKNIPTNDKDKPQTPESRWTDEGGSNQHYRHTDEPASTNNDEPEHSESPGDAGMWKADKNSKRKNVPH